MKGRTIVEAALKDEVLTMTGGKAEFKKTYDELWMVHEVQHCVGFKARIESKLRNTLSVSQEEDG